MLLFNRHIVLRGIFAPEVCALSHGNPQRMSPNDTVTGCLYLAEISARHKGEVWCSPTCGSLSRFKCHSDARSTFLCSMWTLAAACDAVQVNARMEVFFRDSGKTCHVARGLSIQTLPGSSDAGLFDLRWNNLCCASVVRVFHVA